MRLGKCALAALTLGFVVAAPVARAAFVDFIIRGAATINHPGAGQTEFVLDVGGEKAGLGSNDINGQTIGNLQSVAITRLDDRTRFAVGSGPYVAPYLNFWITNGAGKFAVIANEPSDANMQSLYSNGWDLSFADLSNKAAKIYETADKSWLPNAGAGTFTFADFAGYVIQAPTVAQLTAGWAGLGTGAPRELGTNLAYGVNWVFGDTLSNYVSGQPGYLVSNASVTAGAVPETASLSVFVLAALALGAAKWSLRRS